MPLDQDPDLRPTAKSDSDVDLYEKWVCIHMKDEGEWTNSGSYNITHLHLTQAELLSVNKTQTPNLISKLLNSHVYICIYLLLSK